MPEVQCYNKACGLKFDPTNNTEGSCQHHPGVPVFHDALKGWSCCKKRTTDFSYFLKIPGCTQGKHNPVKPDKEIKPDVATKKESHNQKQEKVEVITTPPPKKTVDIEIERPSEDEPLGNLTVKTTSSYNPSKAESPPEIESDEIKIGTSCCNGGCKEAYSNSPRDDTPCIHHPGTAVFHEGMKYWSCCQRKTSDFTSFLNQEGCTQGKHLWRKPKELKVACRYDWHQTGKHVVISIFAKNVNAKTSKFEANQVMFKSDVNFEKGQKFNLHLVLYGIVNPSLSKVTISGTKAEITLVKSAQMTWKNIGKHIEVVDIETDNDKPEEKVKDETEENNDDDDDDSDLDGIDDVIFD